MPLSFHSGRFVESSRSNSILRFLFRHLLNKHLPKTASHMKYTFVYAISNETHEDVIIFKIMTSSSGYSFNYKNLFVFSMPKL